jgi:hypothetical protein
MYQRLLNKKVIIFQKNSFKREGILLEFDSKFLVIDDVRDGTSYISVDEIEKISEVKK